MQLTNLTIRDILTQDAKLTFLVGAGSSVDAPSCQPAGRAMMDDIIRYTCSESEIEDILKIKDLRFEQLIGIIQDGFDKELAIINYYDQCDKPNLQHFYLAEMIIKGHFVMTTNFDYLIEFALLELGVPKEEIKIIITKEDFEKYNNPEQLYNQGIKSLYKIHGSTRNLIEDQSTRNTLISTIKAFGSNKEGLNIFQVEPFKRELFNNISKDRTLVIMGYSGSDDFDVVPTLKILDRIKDVVWINFVYDDEGKERSYEIESDDEPINPTEKVNQILYEIQRMNYADHVYRIDVNTSRMIKELVQDKSKISLENFSLSAIEWLENNIKIPNEFLKYYIPYRIYYEFDMYDDAMRCLQLVLQLAKDSENQSWESNATYHIGQILLAKGNHEEALKLFERSLAIEDWLGNLEKKLIILNRLGGISESIGDYMKAFARYETALFISKEINDLSAKALSLSNIGSIYQLKGQYQDAFNLYIEALKIEEQLGDLKNKAMILSKIGGIYFYLKNFQDALKWLEEALKVNELLGDFSEMAAQINNIGIIYKFLGNLPKAKENYERSLNIAKQLGNQKGIAMSIESIGKIYIAQNDYKTAIKMLQEALIMNEKLGDLPGKVRIFSDIGMIYYKKGNYQESLERFENALLIQTKLGLDDHSDSATLKKNIDAIKKKLNIT